MSLVLLLFLFFATSSAVAQEGDPDGPVYVVQEGDTLWEIASQFGVLVDDLKMANGISEPDQLSIGTYLVIPGLEGIQGILDTQTIPYGETLRSLSRRYQVSVDELAQLNHLTTPAELYAGSTLIVPAERINATIGGRTTVVPGQSLLELAVLRGTNPWAVVISNDLPGTWGVIPGDVLHLPGSEKDGPGALPDAIAGVSLNPTPLVQGKTTLIEVSGQADLKLSGSLAGYELRFVRYKDRYVALQGIHAMLEPGLYPLTLNGILLSETPYNGAPFTFSQLVLIRSGNYPYDPMLNVDPETIDPSVTGPENELWAALGAPFTPEKMWDGIFRSPVPPRFKDCRPSPFGSRRSYNGSPYIYYHSGLDFCGGIGTEIFAPAAGKVIFAGPLVVRGNATVIDHGWGVYTAYAHQSEIFVEPGDILESGQLIGMGGETGRVTGPHLHWEVWAGGVQVDPVDWLDNSFP